MTVEEPGSTASRHTNALLVANECNGHIHLIIGGNAVAGARCTRSLEAGARPIVVANPANGLHHGVQRRVDSGEIEWIQRDFQDEDLAVLGREEVGGYVDAVFVTLTASVEQCMFSPPAYSSTSSSSFWILRSLKYANIECDSF